MIEKVKLLIKNCDEELVKFCCAETENYIKAYCNTDKVPEGASEIAVKMAVYSYKTFGEKEVKSLKRGDFSVTYEKSEFNKLLFPFRKFGW